MLKIPYGSLLLAPMVEISHRAFREFVEDFWPGADYYWTEMASTASFLCGGQFEECFLDTKPCASRTIVQWYTTKEEQLTEALLKHTATVGSEAPSGYDINFACSAPHIEHSGGGIKWMQKPQEAARMIREARQALPEIQLTAKLRLGYEADKENLSAFCSEIAEAGLDALIIHPRFKHEKFKIRHHWDYLDNIRKQLRVPVIGNGDIRTPEACAAAFSVYGIHAVMIGREAVRRPWIFQLIKNKSKNPDYTMDVNLEEAGLAYCSYVTRLLPPEFHLSRLRRFFLYFCDNLKFGHHLRCAVQNAKTTEDIPDLIHNYFQEVPEERIRHEQ